MIKLSRRQKGFTVIELIIATSVFSVMLLLTTTGMIQIGRVYYKGLIVSKTQETTRSISEDIVRAVQFGGTDKIIKSPTVPISGLDTSAVCMNNVRYTYAINTRLAAQNSVSPRTSRHVLWLDIIKDPSICRPVDLTREEPGRNPGNGGSDNSLGAGDTDLSSEAAAQRRELLANNMRLTQFEVSGPADLVNIKLKVVYGEDDVIAPGGNCVPTGNGGQFCAFSALDTFAKRRL